MDLDTGPIRVEQTIEVGRPPGLQHGTPIDATFQLSLGPMDLKPGRHRWLLTVADQEFSTGFYVRGPA